MRVAAKEEEERGAAHPIPDCPRQRRVPSWCWECPAFSKCVSRTSSCSAVATPIQFWAGSLFYASAWSALKQRTSNMNTLISLGTTAAYLYSVAATFVPVIL